MRCILITAAIFGALSIIIGAARQHITGISEADDAYQLLQTGLRYHQLHSVVLLALGLYGMAQGYSKALKVSAYLFAAGMVFFSGGLYAAIILSIPALTMLTPVGGICFIAAWGSLAFIKPPENA